MAVRTHRLFGYGFYGLTEPEVALSSHRRRAFLAALHGHVTTQKSQFLIARIPPILLAYPDARITELGPDGIRETAYEGTEQYRTTRCFLEDGDPFQRHLLRPPGDPDPPGPDQRTSFVQPS